MVDVLISICIGDVVDAYAKASGKQRGQVLKIDK